MTFIIGTPYASGAGYYRNDDRLSGGKLSEDDIRTCPHCQTVIKMREWAKAKVQNFCTRCMAPTCDNVGCDECVPFIQQINRQNDAVVKYQAYVKIAGLEPTPQPSHIKV